MSVVGSRAFVCYVCGQQYRTQTTCTEMDAEVIERYGEPVPDDELVSVCDGCSDDVFWLNEADPAVDICDPSLTADACLDVIVPEIRAHIAHRWAWVFEIGCGIGRLTNPLQAMLPGTHVVGMDINPKFLAMAAQASEAMTWTGLMPVYKVAGNLDDVADPGSVDAIYSMAVFQHIDNDRKRSYIEQVGRVLRPGGVFCFQYVEGTHSSRCMHDALIWDVRAWCETAGLTVQRVQHDLLMPRWTWVTTTREAAA